MCGVVAGGAEDEEVLGLVVFEDQFRGVDSVQFEFWELLAALRAGKMGLFVEGAFEGAHLVFVVVVQADVEEQASQDQAEQARARAHGQEE